MTEPNPSLLKALQVYNATLEQLERAEDNVQKALAQLKRFAGSSTFKIEGKPFQLRKRKDNYYLCELSGKPRKKREPKVVVVAEPPVLTPEDVLDVAALAQVEREKSVDVETVSEETVSVSVSEETVNVESAVMPNGAASHAHAE